MESRNHSEKEFIDGVWRKVRYLEYKRNTEQKLREMRRNYNRKRVKTAAGFFVFLILVSIIFFAAVSINTYTLILLGSVYMGTALLYESFSNISLVKEGD